VIRLLVVARLEDASSLLHAPSVWSEPSLDPHASAGRAFFFLTDEIGNHPITVHIVDQEPSSRNRGLPDCGKHGRVLLVAFEVAKRGEQRQDRRKVLLIRDVRHVGIHEFDSFCPRVGEPLGGNL